MTSKRLGLFGFLALGAMTAYAQSKTTAVLSGSVLDASEAGVPDARVTATNTQTGRALEAASDYRGEYRFVLLPPGVYDVRVEKQGFSTQVHRGVEVTVGQAALLDVRLQVGATQQVVEVNADVALLETERTQQANTIEQESVRNLPINRRDYLTFVLLAPGVADSKALADANTFRVKQTPDSGISFYGSNGRGNNISVDGGETNDAGGGVRPTVSQEAVQEFQINRTNYSAEHGAARGGVVNIVTKAGTNTLRGSALGFFRHESMDAGDPFAIALVSNRLQRVKPDSNRQQFGGTLGGPLRQDRLFFFLGYEQLRRRESAAVPLLTDLSVFEPTAAQEAILSRLPAEQAGALRAALTSPPRTREMFTRNSGVFPFQTDDHKGLLRLDWRASDHDQFTWRFNTTRIYETNPNLAGLVGYSRGYISDWFDLTTVAGWTRTLSPSMVNELRVQYNYYDALTDTNEPHGPALEIAGYGAFNRDRFLPNNSINRRTEVANNLNIVRGSHSLKTGAYLLFRHNWSYSATFMSGRFTFGTLPGAFVSPVLAATTINALQAFNLGLAQSYQQGFGEGAVRDLYPLYAGYFQDSWKVHPRLTLQVGVRYEVDSRKEPLPTEKNNVAPRFGFAWDVAGNKKWIIRGGYGLFFAPIDFQIDYVSNALNEINGYRQIAQVLTVLSATDPLARTGPVNIFTTLRNQGVIGIPTPQRPIREDDLRQFGIVLPRTGPRPPLTVLFRPSENYQNPYAQQASFGIEREITRGLAASIGYIFVRGAHLTTSRDENLLPAPVNPAKGIRDWGVHGLNPTGVAFFRNPLLFQGNVYESAANSFYHGMVIEVHRRFSGRFSAHGNYTFSKAIDETLDFNSDFQPNDQTDRRAERALSAFDQRHKLVLYGQIQCPAQFSFMPIFRANSARPFNLLAGTELNNDRHNTTDRPIFAGRNTGIGPSFWTFDVRLAKQVAMRERAHLEFMVEAFNLFNHLNYASVNNIVGPIAGPFRLEGRHDRTPSQPLGFTAAFDPRRVQLGVRLNF
jgi:hypothetical protein